MKGKLMSEESIHAAAAAAAAPAASVPPATIAAATFLGFSPSEWLVYLSIFWILIQALAFIYERVSRIRRCIKQGKKEVKDEEA